MNKRGVRVIAVLLAVLLALPGLAAPAARFQPLYWPAFEENIYALSPGGGWGDYLALAVQGNLLAFVRREQAEEPACGLTLYDLAHGRALATIPLGNTSWEDHWELGFWAPGRPYLLEEASLSLTVYDQTLMETLSFTPPAGFDVANADPAGQALWCASYADGSLTRFSLPGGEAKVFSAPLPKGWTFSALAGAVPGGVLAAFTNLEGQSLFLSARDTGPMQLMPVISGFSWLPGGLSYAALAGNVYLMPTPGQDRVIQLSAWREEEFVHGLWGNLLLSESFDPGPAFRLYDLSRGLMIAELAAPSGDETPGFSHIALSELGFAVMADNRYELKQFSLYLWDFSQLPLAEPAGMEETTLSGLRARNDERALAIAQKHGITLHTRQAGARFVNDTYYGQPLDQEPVLAASLSALDLLLERLPPGLLQEAYSPYYASLALYLSGGIRPRNREGLRSPSGLSAANGEERYVVLDIRDPSNTRTLAHELMHLLEDRLANHEMPGGRNLLDDWLLLCPPEAPDRGFYNSYHDADGLELSDTRYTADDEGARENPDEVWFIDAYSRSFPLEDRARVFEQLLLSEGSLPDFFSSPHLRRKAQYLCAILRQAFPSLQEAPSLYWERRLPPILYADFAREFEALEAP